MAPFPDRSLSKVFLSLCLINLSHPFSPLWSQGHMLLQHFISPFSPFSLLPVASLRSQSKSCPSIRKFPAPSWLLFHFSFAPVGNLPQGWEHDAFLQLFPSYYGGKATPKAEPCSQRNPACWIRSKMPKMENGICPRPGPAPLQPAECVSSLRPESRMEAWEGCD